MMVAELEVLEKLKAALENNQLANSADFYDELPTRNFFLLTRKMLYALGHWYTGGRPVRKIIFSQVRELAASRAVQMSRVWKKKLLNWMMHFLEDFGL